MAGVIAKLVTVERPLQRSKITLASAQTAGGEIDVLPGH